MKATELRINNLVYNDFTRKQMEVYPMMIVQLSKMDNLDNSNIKPIPLTEDWLLKFGFKKDTWTDNGLIIGSWWNNGSILITDDFKLDGQEEMKSLQYVHQLQNLYFALTNEELTFKSE